jgi:hypothetical protein
MGAEDVSASTNATMPEFIFTTRMSPCKIDQWCVDGAATSMAIYDRSRCFNIRKCNVQIFGSNSAVEEGKMMCTEIGDTYLTAYDRDSGKSSTTHLTNVLISELFPFHIFSEIVAFDRGNTCIKAKNTWTFYANGAFVMHASQRLLNDPSLRGRSDSKLYWVDEKPPVYINNIVQLPAALSSQFSCRTCTFEQSRTPEGIDEYFCVMCHHGISSAPAPVYKHVPSYFDVDSFSSVPVAGVASPRFKCVFCTFDQVSTSPSVCIMCLGCQPGPAKRARIEHTHPTATMCTTRHAPEIFFSRPPVR